MNEFLDVLKFSGLVLAIYLIIILIIAFAREDNSIMDIAYGSAFVMIAWWLASMWQDGWALRQTVILSCVTVWGIRLTTRIFLKNWGKPEDFRYRAWWEEWKKQGMLYSFFRSLGQIYAVQGLVILIVSLPVLIAFSSHEAGLPLDWYNWLGLAVWGIGFCFEFVGDWQLDRFIRQSENQGKIMTTGLWRYTRHPNYFGESMMWWGLFLIVFGLPLAALALFSPVLITFLLTQVSGIPMLEKRWTGRPDWEEYKRRTSAFFPWWPKSAS